MSAILLCSTVPLIWGGSINLCGKYVKRESQKNHKMLGLSVNTCLFVVVLFQISTNRPFHAVFHQINSFGRISSSGIKCGSLDLLRAWSHFLLVPQRFHRIQP